MSSQWAPLEIPPGVVSMGTKRMRSTNWSEVNAIRWIEGKLAPIGGQEIITYPTTFASRCRAIHSWFDLSGTQHIAYVCETNVYVDTGGTLTEITPSGGLEPPGTASAGYGMGQYGKGPYGVPPRPGATTAGVLNVIPDVWSVDNWGALLIVMTSADARLLQWDPAAGGLLTAVPNAPEGRCFAVTADRFVQVFGAITADGFGGPRRWCWCDQGDITNWDFTSVTNQAGFYDIEPASPILAAISGRNGWSMFFTEKKAYLSLYLGLPFVYSQQELADDCAPYSPASICTTSGNIFWMSRQGLFSFDGTSITATPCPIHTWISNNVDDFNARWQAFATHIGMHNELWWFFPQSGQPYNSLAAIFNYKESWWSMARMPRSAGMNSTYAALPIFADGVNLYRHESGSYFNDCDLPWADTFNLNLSSNGRLITLKQMLVNIEGATPGDPSMEQGLNYALYYKNSRLGSAPENVTPLIQVRPDGYVDFRTTGRDIRLRFQVTQQPVSYFTLGAHQVDAVPRGDR
jgi:hypothetical protein